MRGMLTDLAKEPLVAHVATLALADVVEEIGHVADEYGALLEQRSESQAANDMGPVKNLRVEMDGQYDYITTMAFAFSVAEPSDALTTFVASTNRLIDDTNKAYNLRTVKPRTMRTTATSCRIPSSQPILSNRKVATTAARLVRCKAGYPTGIFRICPGCMLEPLSLLTFWSVAAVTPGYFLEME